MRRDNLLFHQKPELESRYWTSVGLVESKTFELEVAVLRLRSKLSLLQAAVNREERANLAEIERKLDAELAAFNRRLEGEAQKIADAFYFGENATTLSADDSKLLKKYYQEIVKRLHPDVAPQTTPEEKTLLKQAIAAYKRADLPTLQAIFYSLGAALPGKSASKSGDAPNSTDANDPANSANPSKSAFDELFARRDALEKSRATLLDSVAQIQATFPFDRADFLDDKAAVLRRLDKLKVKQEELRKIYRRYEAEIAEILRRWEI